MNPTQQRQIDLKMGPRGGAPGRTDIRGCGIPEQMDQPGQSSGKVPFQDSKDRTFWWAKFAARKCIGVCSQNTVVSFLVYEHRGNTKEVHLSLHPRGYEAILFKHTSERGCYSHGCSWFLLHLFSRACLSPQHRSESTVSAVSSSILSWGRSTRHISRNREREYIKCLRQ